MKYEYLLLNFLVLMGPILFSFDRKVHFVSKWRYALGANVIVLVPFIIWDALVAGRHWWFNGEYTSGITLLGLPLGEWLFFITIPFACLFIWEIIATNRMRKDFNIQIFLPFMLLFALLLGIWLYAKGFKYTGLVSIAIGVVILMDIVFRSGVILQTRSYHFLLIVTILVLIFNGYLTARPLVLYNGEFQLGIRIATIPVEDFFYGYSLLFMNIIVYQTLLRRGYA